MKRTLTLRHEALVELTSDDLAHVNGGAITAPWCPTSPLKDCLTFLTCDPTCHTE